jgi:hypothetical protein
LRTNALAKPRQKTRFQIQGSSAGRNQFLAHKVKEDLTSSRLFWISRWHKEVGRNKRMDENGKTLRKERGEGGRKGGSKTGREGEREGERERERERERPHTLHTPMTTHFS